MTKYSSFNDTTVDTIHTTTVLDQTTGSVLLPLFKSSVEHLAKKYEDSNALVLHAKEDNKIALKQANAAKDYLHEILCSVIPTLEDHIPGFTLDKPMSKVTSRADVLAVAKTFLQYLKRNPEEDWAKAVGSLISPAMPPLEQGIKDVSRTRTALQAAQFLRQEAQKELNQRLAKVRKTVEVEKGEHSEEFQSIRTQRSKRRKQKKAQASQSAEASTDAKAAGEAKDAKAPEAKDAKAGGESTDAKAAESKDSKAAAKSKDSKAAAKSKDAKAPEAKDAKEAPAATAASNSDKASEASENSKPAVEATTPSAKPEETSPAAAAPQTDGKAA